MRVSRVAQANGGAHACRAETGERRKRNRPRGNPRLQASGVDVRLADPKTLAVEYQTAREAVVHGSAIKARKRSAAGRFTPGIADSVAPGGGMLYNPQHPSRSCLTIAEADKAPLWIPRCPPIMKCAFRVTSRCVTAATQPL